MSFFSVVILMLIIILILYFMFFICELRNINNQLKQINLHDTNAKVKITSKVSIIKNLVLEINKCIEEKQYVKQKYKKTDEELRKSIANISHDLRTPLTSIKGYLQLIQDDKISQKDKEGYMDIIISRTDVLQNLINQFYDLSRMQSSEYVLKLESINLSNILCETIALFYYDFLKKGIEPRINLNSYEKYNIIADKDAIQRIVFNLIQNSLKYAKKFVNLSLELEENKLKLIIKNDCDNLTVEDSKHLFERFFTSDKVRNGNNTGLGLAIVKTLVEKMNGNIYSFIENNNLNIIIKFTYIK